MDIKAVLNLCVSSWDADWLALSHKGHMAGEAFSQNFVNFCFVVHRPVLVPACKGLIEIEGQTEALRVFEMQAQGSASVHKYDAGSAALMCSAYAARYNFPLPSIKL